MRKLTVGSCFSGIGGIELGLEWTGGFETKWQIENDPYASAVLAKHWPGVKRYGDIRVIRPSDLEPVDVICGGYPCQPFSTVGKRRGESDERNLWPHMFGLIRHFRPRFALLENVTGHFSLGFGRVLADLASIWFDAEWTVLSACAVGAPQTRSRLFIVAYPEGERRGEGDQNTRRMLAGKRKAKERFGSSDNSWWATEPGVDRVVTRIPNRSHRLRCLGNAVVPQVAQKVGEMILEYERRFLAHG